VKSDEVLIRALTADDLPSLDAFRCSAGTPWEDAVEAQVRGPLPQRYLASPPRFDGRMLIGASGDGDVLVIGAHHIEPTLEPDVGYTEVVAVSLTLDSKRFRGEEDPQATAARAKTAFRRSWLRTRHLEGRRTP